MIELTRFSNVWQDAKGRNIRFYTKSLAPGKKVYGEKLLREKGNEYREWDAWKSKLCAAMTKGASQTGIKEGNIVLYLGSSTGTTVSHVSDIVTNSGMVYALDFAPRVVRDLMFVANERKNISPILGDASKPMDYAWRISQADVIFQDITSRDQAEVFLKNCSWFLKKDGFGLLCIKARSIDVSKRPREVFSETRKKLEQSPEVIVVDYRELDPFQKDHCIFICKKK